MGRVDPHVDHTPIWRWFTNSIFEVTAIVNHPLRLCSISRLSYFPYIFYFVNFTISAARGQGLFGTFENVIKDFGILGRGANFPTFLGVILPCFGDDFS